jgi:hypothetical protein
MNKPIGGFFELELRGGEHYHQNGLFLNSGRHCLEYLIINKKIEELFIPVYSCDAIVEPCVRNNLKLSYYKINELLEIEYLDAIPKNSYLLYTNYFGLKDGYIINLSKQFSNLIIDNAQAFYSLPLPSVDTFYSPRKFFGVPDGGILFSEIKKREDLEYKSSLERTSHLLMRTEGQLTEAYAAFQKNELTISADSIHCMSNLTNALLRSIDYKDIKEKRLANFNDLHKQLGALNLLGDVIEIGSFEVPMVYPFMVENKNLRNKLIESKIFVAKYWSNVSEQTSSDTIEYTVAENMIPLPIDQRYGLEEMNYMVRIIKQYV